MHKIIFSLFLVTLAALASADNITILYPSSQYWLVAETPQQVIWTYDVAPQQFSIYLNNKNLSIVNIALTSNVVTNGKNASVVITLNPSQYDQGDYYITFSSIGNISDVYATSENFELKKPGSTSSVYPPPTSASPSSTGSTSSTPNPKSGANGIINTHNTFLLVLCGLIALVLVN